jgi:hypothetical protein
MLIISAIDVLLCTFTAGLTLFFMGSGAHAGASAGKVPGGWPGTLIKINNHEGSELQIISPLRPGQCRPDDGCARSRTCACIVEDPPTRVHPLILGTSTKGSAHILADITVLAEGQMKTFSLDCVSKDQRAISIVDGSAPFVQSPSYLSQQPAPDASSNR